MEEPTKFQKTTFDARIQYYELLRNILSEGKKAAILGDLFGWYRCLRATFVMVSPYIEPELQKDLRDKLGTAKQRIFQLYHHRDQSSKVKLLNDERMDELLFTIDEQLHNAAKSMFLPLEAQNLESFNLESFQRKSDLG